MSDSVKNYFGNMKKKKTIKSSKDDAIEVFELEYPILADEFKQIQKEMYKMFARKHMDYGLNNIALGGDV